MTRINIAGLLAAVALAGCEAKIGGKDEAPAGNVSAEGKAEQDMVSIKAPGVDIKVDLPDSIRDSASVESDSELLYPGSKVGGVHIEAGGNDQGAVEIRFSTPDDPAKVAAWYRDAARTHFKIDGAGREGPAYLLNGHEVDDNSRFKLRIAPAASGSEGILSVQG